MTGGDNRNRSGLAGKGGDNGNRFRLPEQGKMAPLLLLSVLVLQLYKFVAYLPALFPCMSASHPTIPLRLLQTDILLAVIAIQAIVVVPSFSILRPVSGDGALEAELLQRQIRLRFPVETVVPNLLLLLLFIANLLALFVCVLVTQ